MKRQLRFSWTRKIYIHMYVSERVCTTYETSVWALWILYIRRLYQKVVRSRIVCYPLCGVAYVKLNVDALLFRCTLFVWSACFYKKKKKIYWNVSLCEMAAPRPFSCVSRSRTSLTIPPRVKFSFSFYAKEAEICLVRSKFYTLSTFSIITRILYIFLPISNGRTKIRSLIMFNNVMYIGGWKHSCTAGKKIFSILLGEYNQTFVIIKRSADTSVNK